MLVTVTVFVSLLKAIRVFSGVRPSFITLVCAVAGDHCWNEDTLSVEDD